MIGHLKGTILGATERYALLDVMGVGYKLFCPLPVLLAAAPGKTASLFVHTHVREDAITLYGFETDTELEVFERLLDVSGIGPKSALAMLSVHSPGSIADAVERADVVLLSHTPGIGKKTAEKTILELKGKLAHLQDMAVNESTFEVRLALEALGYSPKEVQSVLSKLNPLEKNTSKLITEALSLLK